MICWRAYDLAIWWFCFQVWVPVDYFIIPYTFIFIRLSHLYQKYHAHCIVIRNDRRTGEWNRWEDGWLQLGCRWRETGVGYHLITFFPCAFVLFSLTFSVALFGCLEYDGCCLCFFCFYFFSTVSSSFN